MPEHAPLPLRQLLAPGLVVVTIAWLLFTAVAFDQGALAPLVTEALGDSGGALHETFHDARHLLGVPGH